MGFKIFLSFFIFFRANIIITVSFVLSKEEFCLSITRNGYATPNDEIYRNFAVSTINFSRDEIAMFVAQLIHESGGFRYTEQTDCSGNNNSCASIYDDGQGLSTKSYHGRGYIQLTWAGNYGLASHGLNMSNDNNLLLYPELVANDKSIAMRASVWYWLDRVRPLIKERPGMFGVTTLGINQDECVVINESARRRYDIYLKVADALGIRDAAKENGCYN